ncbi:UvrD-helicase domain-containing protein [Candidatus Saccharibacteria bacterium]|nr:UvrD-helicase domain-containing protein [Candidatus Saccharibacteria bacterium]
MIDETRQKDEADYLDHIFDDINPKIKLDEEQRKVVTSDSEYSLVLAGAGTGKTTTVAAKVKYLVDRKHIDPDKILVLSYTKKATEELIRRINVDMNIPANVSTFHSLGYKYIRHIDNTKHFAVIGENEQDEVFLEYLAKMIFPYPEKLQELAELFTNIDANGGSLLGKFFLHNYMKFNNFDDYFEEYIARKLAETDDIVKRSIDIAERGVNAESPHTILGEYVKSKGEAVIANYLYSHCIDYHYERLYDELVDDQKTYRPDFTIDVGGEKIIIEYFGLSGNEYDNKSYDKIRRIKEEYCRDHHIKLIGLQYKPNRGYLEDLKNALLSLNVKMRERPIQEIYLEQLRQNKLAEFFRLRKFIFDIINMVRGSLKYNGEKSFIKQCEQKIKKSDPGMQRIMWRQMDWIVRFWVYYRTYCHRPNCEMIDYIDMLSLPLNRLYELDPNEFKYQYVIVDEYQDITDKRYQLLRETLQRSHAKLVAVGDDWQSIYSFTGSNIEFIYNFKSYFPGATIYHITNTYRNAQSLIDCAGEFIMRNNFQIRKDLKSNIVPKAKPVQIISDKYGIVGAVKIIHQRYPNDTVCVLTRTNREIRRIMREENLIDSADSKVKTKEIPNFYFDLMTMHKSKGLTYDWVILAPLGGNFPSNVSDFWIKELFRNRPPVEGIEFPEHRRLFYVALTRTRNATVILCNPKKVGRSKFINELEDIINEFQIKKQLV